MQATGKWEEHAIICSFSSAQVPCHVCTLISRNKCWNQFRRLEECKNTWNVDHEQLNVDIKALLIMLEHPNIGVIDTEHLIKAISCKYCLDVLKNVVAVAQFPVEIELFFLGVNAVHIFPVNKNRMG